jgi:hypothetical protein
MDGEAMTEHNIGEAASILVESDFGGLCPFALTYAPGNLTGYALTFARVPYNEQGQLGPYLLMAWLGHGAWLFKLFDGREAPHPNYIAEKYRCGSVDACALHLLLAAALEDEPVCTLADAHVSQAAA